MLAFVLFCNTYASNNNVNLLYALIELVHCVNLCTQGGAVVIIHNVKHELNIAGQGSIASGFLEDIAKPLQSEEQEEGERTYPVSVVQDTQYLFLLICPKSSP